VDVDDEVNDKDEAGINIYFVEHNKLRVGMAGFEGRPIK